MKITKIKFYNYKPYFGEQMLDVPKDGKIIIIKGQNGAGKTTFINGLTWTLYGTKMDLESILNDKILYELNIGEKAEMYIEIHFIHNQKDHILRRGVNVSKNVNDSFSFSDNRLLQILNNEGKLDKIDNEMKIEAYINSILNESVKNYFFFDGARIETFTKDDHYKDVQKAIKNLLKIETIKRARDHIRTVINEIRSSINENIDDEVLENISNKISKLEAEITDNKQDVDNAQKDINGLEKDIANTWNELEHLEQNSEYKMKKKSCEEKLKTVQESIKEMKIELKDKLNKSFNIFADSLLKDSIKYIEEETNNTNEIAIPNYALKAIIKESIDKEHCFICGCDINEDIEKALLKKLPSITNRSSNYEKLLSLANDFKLLIKDSSQQYDKITQLQEAIIDKENKAEELEELIEGYDNKIDNELPDHRQYRNMIKTLEDQKKELIEKKERLISSIKTKEEELAEEESHYNQMSDLLDELNMEKAKLDMSIKIRDEIDRIYDLYEKQQIPKINTKVKQIFDSFIRKEDVYKNIYIDDNYKLNVNRGYSNKNVLNEISYGERQILSLSLILALATVSGDMGPFVMDTPMGNLDPVHRKKLLKNIPGLISQLFLLVTGSEFTDDLYEICEEEIAAEYNLKFNQGMTKIEREVY